MMLIYGVPAATIDHDSPRRLSGVLEMLTKTDIAGGLRSGSQPLLMVSFDAIADNAPPPTTAMISTLDMHGFAFTPFYS